MCALLSENPARLYGAYPRKGVIAPGSDADLVVYDPAADKTITAGTQLSAAGYTPTRAGGRRAPSRRSICAARSPSTTAR
ncbi:MAG: amidohydrolase family protein [Oscillospiraceae bacterium]